MMKISWKHHYLWGLQIKKKVSEGYSTEMVRKTEENHSGQGRTKTLEGSRKSENIS